MLKKLLKHDFISVWRLALPVFAIATGIVFFAYIMRSIGSENPVLRLFNTLLFPTAIIVLIVACVVIFCLPVLHFYRNLMTGEGYLSFTLPVTTYQIVLSKLIVGAATMLCNLAFTVGGFLLLLSTEADLSTFSLKGLHMPDGASPAPFITIMVITIIISTVCQQIYLYLAICLGQVVSKNKIIGSVLGYAIIYAVNQVINLAILVVMLLCIGFDNLDTFMTNTGNLLTFFGILVAEYAILGTVSYVLSGRILKNRLNLN